MATPALLQETPATAPLKQKKPPRPDQYWLHALLFVVTLFSTTVVGMRYSYNFNRGLFPLASDADIFPYDWVIANFRHLPDGLPFSCTLLGILLVHEFGHYFACRWHGIRATLPFMLPAPSLSGTAGAVIRLKSRIKSSSALIAIGAFGPIAGFLVAIVTATIGLALSKPVASTPASLVSFSKPLLVTFLMHFLSGPLRLNLTGPLLWHPIFVASWIGLLITSLNLIPAGQLDGGHILFSVSPKLHRYMTFFVIGFLLCAGVFRWLGWLFWAALLLLPGMRHPSVPSTEKVPGRLLVLAPIALTIFILCFTPEPFHDSSLMNVWYKVRHHSTSGAAHPHQP